VPCASAAECAAGLAWERLRLWERIHELAADETGEDVELFRYLAAEFTRPEQLLGGGGRSVSRAQHLAWAKARALEYVDQGELIQAHASIASDLNKHPETRSHPRVLLGMKELMKGRLRTPEAMREHIEGYR
jgi:hypothetical protein